MNREFFRTNTWKIGGVIYREVELSYDGIKEIPAVEAVGWNAATRGRQWVGSL